MPGKCSKTVSLPIVDADAAGIDIGATQIFVAVPAVRDSEPVRCFQTFTVDLQRLADWLQQCGIRTVAIVYASHCTSFGRCETFSISRRLLDNLTRASSKLWPTAESRAYNQYFQSLIWYNCLPC
jgi:hypothetical protein